MAAKRFFQGRPSHAKTKRRVKERKLLLESLEDRLLLCGDCFKDPDFDYVGKYKQYHKNSGKIGSGTAELIAPKWAITAWHVAKFKATHPNGGAAEVSFPGVKAYVTKVYKAPGVDIALLKLNKDVPKNSKRVTPVALFKSTFHPSQGTMNFTLIGRSGGLHSHRIQGRSQGTTFKIVGNKPGKAGDSGGAWVKERFGKLPDVQFAVLHGGGTAPQVGPISNWIEKTVGPGQITWVTQNVLTNGLPTDTHTWTGNDRLRYWENKGNWSSGGTPGEVGATTRNHDTARLSWMGAVTKVFPNPTVRKGWSLGRIEILSNRDHGVRVNGASDWKEQTGSNRKIIRLNGADGQAFMVHGDPDGSFVHTITAGVGVTVQEDLQWNVGGDETLLVNGRLSGKGKIIKTGSGTLKLGNTANSVINNGTNPLEIRAGQVTLAKKVGSSAIRGDVLIRGADATLLLAQNEQVANSAIVTLQDGQFNLNGNSETVKGLVLEHGSVQGGLLVAGAAGFQVESGIITTDLAGNGGLTKTTSGDVTLDGNVAYVGPTQIHDGILRVNGTMTSDVNVAGGWLVGDSTIIGDVNISSNGNISAGKDVGLTSIDGDLTLDGSLLVQIGKSEQGITTDFLDITGAVSLSGKLQISLADDLELEIGDSFDIISAAQGITGELRLASLPDPPVPAQWRVTYSDQVATLRLVPAAFGLHIVDSTISEKDGVTTATVTREDPQGEVTVQISSDNSGELSFAASVVIADGRVTSEPFQIEAVDNTLLDGTKTVTITATADDLFSETGTLKITDYEAITVAIDADVIGENAGPAAATATIMRSNTDISEPLTVTLSSSDTSEVVIAASLTFAAEQSSIILPIDAIDDALLDGTQLVTIKGVADNYESVAGTVNVTDHEQLTFSIDDAELMEMTHTRATLTRTNTEDTEPLVVLFSGGKGKIRHPDSITIPAGQPSVSFDLDALYGGKAGGAHRMNVFATAAGFLNVDQVLEVTEDPSPWHNRRNPYNVDNNSSNLVMPYHALLMIDKINELAHDGSTALARPLTAPTFFYDVKPDNYLTPVDIVRVINHLNRMSESGEDAEKAEGEDELHIGNWGLHRGSQGLASTSRPLSHVTRPSLISPLTLTDDAYRTGEVAYQEVDLRPQQSNRQRWAAAIDQLLEDDVDFLWDDDFAPALN
ncbi:MAG: hypothetical protein OSB47_00010 [Pirellulaceae bacterium]|nr:hypothetical protein [Pirellulaceae bacterium]